MNNNQNKYEHPSKSSQIDGLLKSFTHKIPLFAFIIGFALVGTYLLQASHASSLVTSVKSGNWSDPTVWSTGKVPAEIDQVTITEGQTLTADIDSKVDGILVRPGANLNFAPNKSITIQTTANVIVDGTLRMKQANPALSHVLKFVGIDESKFVGGGVVPLETDVGLWVTGAGQLDTEGNQKMSWTRATDGISAGATSVTLDKEPLGWQIGDEISITPTESPSVGDSSWQNFENRTVSAISGNTVSFTGGMTKPHPMVNNQWAAEVIDLTRNVRIEGSGDGQARPESNGRAHVFINSSKPQSIKYTQLRYVGPRKVDGAYTDLVLGRYGLHFHMSGEGSRGSQVIGTVIRDAGSHAYVAHASNGVYFGDTVSFNTFDDAYWWDTSPDTRTPGPETDDTVYDHAMAAKVRIDPDFRGSRLTGFSLSQGLNNTILDSVGVGVQGGKESSGMSWGETSGTNGPGLWNFSQGNKAHNNKSMGIFTWQNTEKNHVIANFDGYNNGLYGISHGAYGNSYHYENINLYGNKLAGLNLSAVSKVDSPIRFTNLTIDGAGMSEYGITSFDHTFDGTTNLTVFRNLNVKNVTKSGLFIGSSARNKPNSISFEDSTFNTPTDIFFTPESPAGNFVLLQSNASTATRVEKTGRTTIPPYAKNIDDTNPQSVITYPRSGDSVSGTVPVSVSSFDLFGVVKMELYVNDVLNQTDSSFPYGFLWDTSGSTGAKNIFVKVFDGVGRSTKSTTNTVFANGTVTPPPPPPTTDTTPPVTSITNPTNGSSVTSTVAVSAGATDNVGVAKVVFLRNGTIVSTDTSAPYGFDWDTKTVANGTYSLISKAYDAANNVGTSTSVAVTVSNGVTDSTPPTAPTNLAGAAASSNQINLKWSASTDNVAVAKYRIFRNGASLAIVSATASPVYADTTALPNTSYGYTVRAVDAAGNTSLDSNKATVVTPALLDTTKPTTPTALSATTTTTSIKLTWQASSDAGGIAGYYVYRNGIVLTQNIGNVTNYTDITAVAGIAYSYTVRAVDTAKNVSDASNAASATIPIPTPVADTIPPSAPTNLVNRRVSTHQVNLSWTASTDNVKVVRYDIFRSINSGAYTKIGSSTSTSYGDGTLKFTDKKTSYYVKAVDSSANKSPNSNVATSYYR